MAVRWYEQVKTPQVGVNVLPNPTFSNGTVGWGVGATGTPPGSYADADAISHPYSAVWDLPNAQGGYTHLEPPIYWGNANVIFWLQATKGLTAVSDQSWASGEQALHFKDTSYGTGGAFGSGLSCKQLIYMRAGEEWSINFDWKRINPNAARNRLRVAFFTIYSDYSNEIMNGYPVVLPWQASGGEYVHMTYSQTWVMPDDFAYVDPAVALPTLMSIQWEDAYPNTVTGEFQIRQGIDLHWSGGYSPPSGGGGGGGGGPAPPPTNNPEPGTTWTDDEGRVVGADQFWHAGGIGQRNWVHRDTSLAWVGNEVESLRLRVGPDGKVWVAWSEGADVEPSGWHGAARCFVWYWNDGDGTACDGHVEVGQWVDTQLPDPPDMDPAVDEFTTENVADALNVDIAFVGKDGPSNWPSVFYSVEYWWTGPPYVTDHRNLVYAEYNGTGWQNRLKFNADDVWIMGDRRIGTGTLYVSFWDWWTQGIRLVEAGDDLYLFLALGHTQYGDRGVVGRLKKSGHTSMPDPSAPVVDNFNRTEDPLSDPWEAQYPLWNGAYFAVRADGSTATMTDYGGGVYRRTDQDFDDVEIGFTVGAAAQGSGLCGVAWRGSADEWVNSRDFYGYALFFMRADFGMGVVDRVEIRTEAVGTRTIWQNDFPAGTIQVGDEFVVQNVGTLMRVWRKPAGGSWNLLADFRDYTYTSGFTGIMLNLWEPNDPAPKLDDFRVKALDPADFDMWGFESLSPITADQATLPGEGYWSYTGDPYLFNTGRWGNGWEFPSVDACSDGRNLFAVYTTDTPSQAADMLVARADMGQEVGWMPASKEHQPIVEYDELLTGNVVYKNGYLYQTADLYGDNRYVVVLRYKVNGVVAPDFQTNVTFVHGRR